MKMKLYSLFIVLLLLSCKGREEVTQNDLFETSFQNYREISILEDFQKVSDTFIYTEKKGDDFRLLHLKKDNEDVVLFYKVVNRDSIVPSKFEYTALDTLRVSNLKTNQRFTIGYCTKEGIVDEQIIAVVKDTTGLYMNVVRAWVANLETQNIEIMENVAGLRCLNEFYEYREELVEPENFPEQ